MDNKIIGKAQDLVLFLMGQDIDRNALWELKLHKKKKSLSQNGYYWALCGQLAKKTKVSASRIHNLHLRQLAQIDTEYMEKMGGHPVTVFIPDTDEAENEALENEKFHIKPTSAIRVGNDGITYRGYIVIKGCSSFDVEQMSALLELMLQDCKEQDIQVLTPNELARMKEVEKQLEQKHNAGRQ